MIGGEINSKVYSQKKTCKMPVTNTCMKYLHKGVVPAFLEDILFCTVCFACTDLK